MLALSKADLVPAERAEAARERWAARLGDDVPVLVTSSATGQGLDALGAELLRRVPVEPPAPGELEADLDALAEHRVFRPARGKGFDVERVGERAFRVSGEPVERLLARHDLDNDEALAHVERRLARMGVIRALEEHGFEPGDDVEIGGVVFELDPAS
jgi:GTP-binding protein